MIVLGIFFFCVSAVLGLVLLTDAVERFWQGRPGLPVRRHGRRSPATHYYERPRIVEPGCCKGCGMDDLPLDYYRRCVYCAELCELKGGIRSVAPRWPGDSEFSSPSRMYPSASLAADISSISMERIRG